jgi:hypothetical protein
MLYSCIISNKFDLKQTIRVLHNIQRYRKSLNRFFKVCYVPATNAVFIAYFSSFFAAAINSTDEANKAAGTRR